MLKKIKEWIRPQGLEGASTPLNRKATFVVTYEKKLIGTLTLDHGNWSFSYSDEYKEEKFLAPLFDFPDVDKVYTSDSLWPFFEGRIPGLKQPLIQETIRKEKIDQTDLVALLARFGKRTIANPFVLEQKQGFALT